MYSDFHNDCSFFSTKKTILIPNAENKDRTSAFWLRNLNSNFFLSRKKNVHYENQSMYVCVCVLMAGYFSVRHFKV
jgi:hypothetical protein